MIRTDLGLERLHVVFVRVAALVVRFLVLILAVRIHHFHILRIAQMQVLTEVPRIRHLLGLGLGLEFGVGLDTAGFATRGRECEVHEP